MIEKYLWKFLRKAEPAYHPSKTSWAQQGEDLLIDFVFTQYLNCKTPSYLDFGANHPYHLSNTYFFYKKGARGVNVEPDPSLLIQLEEKRPFDININAGVGKEKGSFDFFLMSNPTLNTFSKEMAEEYTQRSQFGYPSIRETRKIEVLTANEILEKHFLEDKLYFISIDVEGLDYIILQSIDYTRYRPPLICVETNGKDEELYNSFMKSKGYLLYANNQINSIFLTEEKFPRD
jgi:FkbM family methyltransferase